MSKYMQLRILTQIEEGGGRGGGAGEGGKGAE